MKKTMGLMIAAMLAWASVAGATAIDGRVLSLQERAAHAGATHCFTVDYSDLATTATNTAETLTFAVSAKQSVRFVSMKLDTAFDTGNTNYTGSLAVTVGDGTDADLYLTSTELASDGSEVFFKFDSGYSSTVTVTPTTTALVYLGATTNLTTNTVVTSIAAAYSPGALGRKVYTADDTIDFTFTPNTEEATSANTSGLVKFYMIIE